jgi:hypothetical protein
MMFFGTMTKVCKRLMRLYHPPTPSQSDYVDGVFGVWAGNGANGKPDQWNLSVLVSSFRNIIKKLPNSFVHPAQWKNDAVFQLLIEAEKTVTFGL